ncbi:N-6 DNA methylase [Spiractinospora alimapuensis]|uniref:N-6 DNA methylase n=1 Tax=Spiractinospora alimapuensis TaxID=2820884 RepID=UPI002ED5E19D
MTESSQRAYEQQVSAADIARLAGVTRAAVSNWRRRHEDFPTPITDRGTVARFRLSEVRAWLGRQHKGELESADVRLWNALRSTYHSDMAAGVAAVAELLTGGAPGDLGEEAAADARELATEGSASQAVQVLVERLGRSPLRADTELTTDLRLVRVIARAVDGSARSVFDPACGTGSLLLGVGARDAQRYGQEAVGSAARLTRARAALAGAPETEVRIGDALRVDRWPELRTELVICHPPAPTPEWGREELLVDPRWELALPPRAESEMAWLQHAYAHTLPGGMAAVVMSTAAAYRRTARRIRSEAVRRGLLTQVLALPAGLATGHAQPVHLWVLRRPSPRTPAVREVRMVDLTGTSPDDVLDPEQAPSATLPLVDLLDDTVDLSPQRHVAERSGDLLGDYEALRAEFDEALATLHGSLPNVLPELTEGGEDTGHSMARLADLASAGLVDLSGERPRALDEQLDSDFLNGFLYSPANRGRATSASGTHRTDAALPRFRG